MIESLRAEIEKSLAKLTQDISKQPLETLIEALEEAYEKALVADYLEKRMSRRNKLQQRIISKIEEATAGESAPEMLDEVVVEAPKAAAPSASNYSPEIKVVAVPDGPPPMPNHEMEQEPEVKVDVATPAPKAAPVIATPPPAPVKVAAPVTAPKAAAPQTSIADKAQSQPAQKSLHTKLASKNLSFGLNDRIAYVKHLFEGSTEDFNRVVSQLSTFEDWAETETFIDEMVKPDFDWSGKEEYEERFLNQIKARFE
jgi:hypothetical protein